MKTSRSFLPALLMCVFLSAAAVPRSPFLYFPAAQEPESVSTGSPAQPSDHSEESLNAGSSGLDHSEESLDAGSSGLDLSEDSLKAGSPAPTLINESPDGYRECPDLAATGQYVWNSISGQILCTGLSDQEPAAVLSVSGLLSEGETTDRLSLTSWNTESILLCVPVYTEKGLKSVELFELKYNDLKHNDSSIEVLSSQDAGEKLRFLYENDDKWLEIDMISNHQRLFFAALDQDFQMHFFLYTPSDDTLVPLGDRELSLCRAIFPFGEDMMMAEQDDLYESVLHLTLFSLKDASTEELYRINVNTTDEMFNFAFDEDENRLFFTANNLVYAVNPESTEAPAAVGRLNTEANKFRLGILTEGRYVCQSTDGQLLSCDAHGQIPVKQLLIADTMGIDTLSEAAADFNLICPDYTVSVRTSQYEEDVQAELQRNPQAYDLYILTYGSDPWRTLSDQGMMANLSEDVRSAHSGSTPMSDETNIHLSDLLTDMPQGIRNAVTKDGHMIAFPVSVMNVCHSVNPEAVEALTGLSLEELPTDIVGFLEFLRDLAKKGTLKGNSQYTLYDEGTGKDQYREIVLDYILEKALLLSETGQANEEDLISTLRTALETFQTINWDGLGLSEADTGRTPLFSDAYLQTEVIDNEEGFVFRPISFIPENGRLIPQTLSLLCVNPNSANREAAIAFTEHLFDKMKASEKMALCKSLNDPVPNAGYDEDLAYLENTADELAQLAANESDPSKKKQLENELEDLKAYTQRYRLNARFAVSGDSISKYRSFEDDMVPFTNVFWTDAGTARAQYDFLEGRITPDQLISRLRKYLLRDQ